MFRFSFLKNIRLIKYKEKGLNYLLNLFDALELDEEDDGEDIVVVEPLDGAQVDVQDTVLLLPSHTSANRNLQKLNIVFF